MQSGTQWCGDRNDSGECVQTEYNIPGHFQKERLRVLSWCRNGSTVKREERGGSQQYKRECCEGREVDNVPGMRVDRIFANGLNRENQEINGKQEMEQVRRCGRRRRKINDITQRDGLYSHDNNKSDYKNHAA